MKKVFALFALLFAFSFTTVEVFAQDSTPTSYDFSTPDAGNQAYVRFLQEVAYELNSSCGTTYCYGQLYQAHKRGDLSFEQVDRYSWRVSIGGNITIVILEGF